MSSHSEGYEIRIRPSKGLVNIDLQGLWEYRDLLYLMVRRDFLSKYAQTILGPLWFIIQPLSMTLIFTVIFSRVAGIPTDGVPPFLFYLCGQLGWGYFAQNFGSTSSTFVNNAGIFGKVYFPRLVVPLSAVISNLVATLIHATMFMIFWLWFKFFTASGGSFHMSWSALAVPLIVAQIAAVSLGVGLWFSALTAKYRDFVQLGGFLIQVWMYATPVIYPLSQITEKWQKWMALNPMAMPLESLRAVLLGTGSVNATQVIISIAIAGVLLFTGLLVFEKVERTFVDTV
jgi:lipopolysaccharide transport system permease protein